MDADNESYIQEAITQLCRGKTLLVIAHRLNTIRHADEILVIDQGRIVQAGDHDTLMAEEGIYRRFMAPTTHLWRRRAFIAASSPPAPIPPVGAGKGRGAKEKNDRDACPGHSSFQLLPLIDPGGHTNPI